MPDDLAEALAMDLDLVERLATERVEEGLPFPAATDGHALRLLFVRLRHAEALAAPPAGSVGRLVGTWRQSATDCDAHSNGTEDGWYDMAEVYRECADELAHALGVEVKG